MSLYTRLSSLIPKNSQFPTYPSALTAASQTKAAGVGELCVRVSGDYFIFWYKGKNPGSSSWDWIGLFDEGATDKQWQYHAWNWACNGSIFTTRKKPPGNKTARYLIYDGNKYKSIKETPVLRTQIWDWNPRNIAFKAGYDPVTSEIHVAVDAGAKEGKPGYIEPGDWVGIWDRTNLGINDALWRSRVKSLPRSQVGDFDLYQSEGQIVKRVEGHGYTACYCRDSDGESRIIAEVLIRYGACSP